MQDEEEQDGCKGAVVTSENSNPREASRSVVVVRWSKHMRYNNGAGNRVGLSDRREIVACAGRWYMAAVCASGGVRAQAPLVANLLQPRGAAITRAAVWLVHGLLDTLTGDHRHVVGLFVAGSGAVASHRMIDTCTCSLDQILCTRIDFHGQVPKDNRCF